MRGREFRREGKRRLSTRILQNQLLILALTSAIGFVLLALAQRAEIDRQYEHEALSIAEAAASDPAIRTAMAEDGPDSVIQTAAQRYAAATSARYVVVIDLNRVRHSHPNPALIGKRVTEPIAVLDGQPHVGINNGSTGRSANGKAPLLAPDGNLVGEVSVGILESNAVDELWRELPVFGLFASIALALGAIASALLARRLKRTTFGLELEEIAGLLQDREAMLHGIREGVIAFDPQERISLVNDEARRLLGFGSALGCRLEDLLPEGRLRGALDGTLTGSDLVVLTDGHCLAVNRMPVVLHGRRLGAVVTVRDRTEMVGLLRELDSVRGLTNALRSQQHEFSNRMHTLSGLLELGEYGAAQEFATECAGAEPALTESVRERIGNPTMVGLIVAKTTVAAERGVELSLDEDSWLSEEPAHLSRLLTIVGNLVDNAVDAAASAPGDGHGDGDARARSGGGAGAGGPGGGPGGCGCGWRRTPPGGGCWCGSRTTVPGYRWTGWSGSSRTAGPPSRSAAPRAGDSGWRWCTGWCCGTAGGSTSGPARPGRSSRWSCRCRWGARSRRRAPRACSPGPAWGWGQARGY